MNNNEFTELQERVNKLQQQHDKAVIRKETVMERLKKEFGISTVEEAQAKLQEMKDDIDAQNAAIDKRKRQVEAKIEEYEESLNGQ